MTPMPESILAAIRAHAQAEAPRECCGVVIVRAGKLRYIPCANLAASPAEHFVLSPHDFAQAEDQGEIVRIVHSHPYAAPEPSQADRIGCEVSGLPWLIVNWPVGTVHEFAPSGYRAPLIGRTWVHAVLDCYSLVRDYYRETLRIDLPDFHRDVQWWLRGGNLYAEGFAQAGFAEVPAHTLAEHDVLLMQIGAPVINHAAVYIGDGHIVQHCAGRLSSRDVYGGAWRRATRKVVRHEERL